jgi:hypothetical protein
MLESQADAQTKGYVLCGPRQGGLTPRDKATKSHSRHIGIDSPDTVPEDRLPSWAIGPRQRGR